ncbi:TRAP transporter substrate-binding protein DctP [Oricola sp.]|uniref:TRAP transporter substrate-binding protein n=1 Tax=Oricola sp. TaxID=1979950 RepID=UPI0025F60418|nr:TRAP transporter substrate-binding protein DctP [Oricola sp.]MCI5075398.1 TRAP transporter substrate-binding protein DctP [Oricola sp.]
MVLSHGYSPSHVIAARGIDPWTSCVEEKSDGDLTFEVFPSGQIASIKESLDALNNGLAGVSAIAIGYESARLPLNGVTMLPDMGGSVEEMAASYRAALESGPLADEMDGNGIHPVFNIMLPVYQIVSAVGPIDTLDAFKGKVIRSGGGAMNFTLQSVGASPSEIPSADMYVAMERKTVDATLSALSSVKPYKLDELVNAISSNGRFGTFATVFAMNKGIWDGLSSENQEAVTACGKEIETSLAAYLDEANTSLQEEFAAKGIEIYAFSDETLEAMDAKLGEVADSYIARLSERGLPAREAYDAYRMTLGR